MQFLDSLFGLCSTVDHPDGAQDHSVGVCCSCYAGGGRLRGFGWRGSRWGWRLFCRRSSRRCYRRWGRCGWRGCRLGNEAIDSRARFSVACGAVSRSRAGHASFNYYWVGIGRLVLQHARFDRDGVTWPAKPAMQKTQLAIADRVSGHWLACLSFCARVRSAWTSARSRRPRPALTSWGVNPMKSTAGGRGRCLSPLRVGLGRLRF